MCECAKSVDAISETAEEDTEQSETKKVRLDNKTEAEEPSLTNSLKAWYGRHSSPSTKEDHPNEPACHCGQKSLYMFAGTDESGQNYWETNTCESDTLIIVLDHQLPLNEVISLTKHARTLQDGLWALRGKDLEVARALLQLQKNLNQEGRHLEMCLARIVLSYNYDMRVTCVLSLWNWPENLPCALQFLSSDSHSAMISMEGDTGNEGYQKRYHYEFVGILMFP